MTTVEPAWIQRAPAPALRAWIDSYHGYCYAAAGGLHRGLPSRHLTCIVSIGEPIEVVAQTDPSQAPDTYRFVLSGLQARAALIANEGVQRGVAIELTPVGARWLLGMPAAALWDLSIEAAGALGPAADELWERLQAEPTWGGRFRVCDEVLGRMIAARGPAAELCRAWDQLIASHGCVGVGELAADTGYSVAHLRRRFVAEFGLSPKLAARVIRFDRARHLLVARRNSPISQLAGTCGYYDQAHLDRDFAEFAGCPPSTLLAELSAP